METSKDSPLFDIHAPGIDVSQIVDDIRAAVEEKKRKGVYSDCRVARAERTNLGNLKDEDEFLEFFLEGMQDAVFVDIGDFEIHERRARFAPLLVALKSLIWKLLKFYTYRLWSQQNQANGLLLSALDAVESRNRDRIRQLEERLSKVEQATPKR